MSSLTDIAPQKLERVIDLVRAAGLDVSDWQNFGGGKAKEATNPKYCYEWAFVEPGNKVVLNLWLASTLTENGELFQEINMRERAALPGPSGSKQVWTTRALKMDQAIETAYKDNLPVRVIVCDGARRDPYDPNSKASKVTKRSLDPVAWAVTSYDAATGQSRLTRGAAPFPFIDQFAANPTQTEQAKKHGIVGEVFSRDPIVRKQVLIRAGGKCELCGQQGFVMLNGAIYLETHHVIALSKNGPDLTTNVAALCPNHHRQAHHGMNADVLRTTLQAYLSKV